MAAPGTPKRRYKRGKADGAIDLSNAEFVQRDVRRDRHAEHGCKRWREG